jgi:hypothetical protein
MPSLSRETRRDFQTGGDTNRRSEALATEIRSRHACSAKLGMPTYPQAT